MQVLLADVPELDSRAATRDVKEAISVVCVDTVLLSESSSFLRSSILTCC